MKLQLLLVCRLRRFLVGKFSIIQKNVQSWNIFVVHSAEDFRTCAGLVVAGLEFCGLTDCCRFERLLRH